MLKHDISQYYPLKSIFEQLFGKKAWQELKECTDMRVWKKYYSKLLSAISISTKESVKVTDKNWVKEFDVILEHGRKGLNDIKAIDELHASVLATLVSIVFLQIGCIPNRYSVDKVTLSKSNWQLDDRRSVQYVQTIEQKNKTFFCALQKSRGVEDSINLFNEFKKTKQKDFEDWCIKEKHITI